VARRLGADPVGLVFAARDLGAELAGLPELEVAGLGDSDARALLEAALAGPLDARVRDLIIAETRGNPLALLELRRGLSPAELAGGFGLPGAAPLAGRIEDSFARRLDALPAEGRRLLQVAAADPSGDRSLVWRAAGRWHPGPGRGAGGGGRAGRVRRPGAVPASAGALGGLPVSVILRHTADARGAGGCDDPITDPDRRAWHRAQAAAGPDEVAAELERSAGRRRPGAALAAAAAFLERSMLLSADPARHAERILAAAQASMQAGAFGKALERWRRRRPGRWMNSRAPRADLLRGHVAGVLTQGGAMSGRLEGRRRVAGTLERPGRRSVIRCDEAVTPAIILRRAPVATGSSPIRATTLRRQAPCGNGLT
jgi:hypothetical protein